ncbi:MAG: hypothetical protein Q8O26_05640 [Phreatobacter sp.]|uniref:hypothetical protein n=1 Tax=Phreatobacter sp. TaxID=1966341 RepID=UPI0027327D57|nr:hypothetical protein [Phreatobacter sp.]MDP2801349.1 hypothetical protein [Phreatobacter sp.]
MALPAAPEDPLFYVVEIDLPEGGQTTFRDWYAHVHAPHLYEAGFTTCTSYQAARGRMDIVDVYQAPGWSIFESAAFARYRRLASADPHLPPFMAGIANIRTPYVAWPDSGLAAAEPLAADWLTILRFDADDGALAAVAAWLGAGGGEDLSARSVVRTRLLTRTRPAPTGTSDRPAAALVLESRRDPGAALPNGAPPALTGAAGPHFTGSRLYPWPDDTALRTEPSGRNR